MTSLTHDSVRKLALALPETEESSHRGRADLRVRGKIFATLPEGSVNLKTTPDELESLLEMDSQTFQKVWGMHWVGIDLTRVEPDVLEELVRDAWRSAAPKSLAKALDD